MLNDDEENISSEGSEKNPQAAEAEEAKRLWNRVLPQRQRFEDTKSDIIEEEDDDEDSDRTVRHNIDPDQDESDIGTPKS